MDSSRSTAAHRDYPVPIHFRIHGRHRRGIAYHHQMMCYVDSIIDSPQYTAAEKERVVASHMSVLRGELGDDIAPFAAQFREWLHAKKLSLDYGLRPLAAMAGDIHRRGFASWQALEQYLTELATPFGRLMLALYDETDPRLLAAADGAVIACQLLDNLCDLKEDYEKLGWVNLPADWLSKAGVTPAMFVAPQASPPLRDVVERTLMEIRPRLEAAAVLGKEVKHPFFAWEIRVFLGYCLQLCALLERGADPMAQKIALSPFQKGQILLAALRRGENSH